MESLGQGLMVPGRAETGSWSVGRMGGDSMGSEREPWVGWGETLRGLDRDRQARWCPSGPDMEVVRVLELLLIQFYSLYLK